ncbi:unnamed protein product [Penicillium salamii]|uniref:Secreted protein n=1 Tax=Penicillium salamii TaxID=1612424 RepID=A0A9W4J6N0_9EURO|nr:unnamed protein product [Penicillium salamii]
MSVFNLLILPRLLLCLWSPATVPALSVVCSPVPAMAYKFPRGGDFICFACFQSPEALGLGDFMTVMTEFLSAHRHLSIICTVQISHL